MKIAIDIRKAAGEKAGKGFYTFNIVKSLLEQDHKNKYFLITKEKVPGFEEYKNAKQIEIKSSGMLWHFRTIRLLKKLKIELYIAPTSYIVPSLLPKSIKSIIIVHDLVALLYPHTHNRKAVIIEKIFLKRAAKKADKIVAISKNTRDDLIEKFNITEKKIQIIPCAADQKFKPVPQQKLKEFAQKTNLPKNFFLAVSTIEPRKNYLNLLKAFNEFIKENPGFHLIIVGKNGWQYQTVYDFIEKNHLSEKVHILGYLSGRSLINLYNLAFAFVFPSYYEGFGIPPLEAMQCSCPVIASETSSIPEVVGNAAILIDPQNSKSIKNAMNTILSDEIRKQLIKKGVEQSQKFSWKLSANQLLKLINSMQ